MRQVVLIYMLNYCIISFLNALTGNPLRRVAHWLAMHGEPECDDCYRPLKYVEGGWR